MIETAILANEANIVQSSALKGRFFILRALKRVATANAASGQRTLLVTIKVTFE